MFLPSAQHLWHVIKVSCDDQLVKGRIWTAPAVLELIEESSNFEDLLAAASLLRQDCCETSVYGRNPRQHVQSQAKASRLKFSKRFAARDNVHSKFVSAALLGLISAHLVKRIEPMAVAYSITSIAKAGFVSLFRWYLALLCDGQIPLTRIKMDCYVSREPWATLQSDEFL
jgi:hypothetical protein